MENNTEEGTQNTNTNTNTTLNKDKNYEILSEDESNYDISFKIIVIGNSGN
jgi:hypothetical protein